MDDSPINKRETASSTVEEVATTLPDGTRKVVATTTITDDAGQIISTTTTTKHLPSIPTVVTEERQLPNGLVEIKTSTTVIHPGGRKEVTIDIEHGQPAEPSKTASEAKSEDAAPSSDAGPPVASGLELGGDDDAGPPLPPAMAKAVAMDAAVRSGIDPPGRSRPELIRDVGPPSPLLDAGLGGKIASGVGVEKTAAGVGIETIDDEIPEPILPGAAVKEDKNDAGIEMIDDEGPEPVLRLRSAVPVEEVNTHASGRIVSPANLDDEGGGAQPTNANEEVQNAIEETGPANATQGEAAYIVPEAYIPEEVDVIDAVAEPLLPWWRQRRTRVLFAVVCLLAIAAAIAIGVSSSRESAVVAVAFTSPPSLSAVPSSEPSTSPPTLEPTVAPSTSQAPSLAPSYCADQISSSARKIDLPINEPIYPEIKFEGNNAVVVAREDGTSSIYIIFLAFDNGEWNRASLLIEDYNELADESPYDYSVALSDDTVLVGFPQKATDAGDEAGIVYIFEQDSGGFWAKVGTLTPEGGGQSGAFFAHRIHMDNDLAIFGSLNEQAIYVFQKTANGWLQRTKHDIDYDAAVFIMTGDMFISVDWEFAEIHLYQYDRSNEIVTLQTTLAVDPGIREHGSGVSQAMATGSSKMILNVRLSDNYLVYSTTVGSFVGTEFSYATEGVFVYERKNNNELALSQRFDASDYEERFGWELTIEKDLLVIGGGNHTYVFSEQQDGSFVESFRLDGSYDLLKMSDRNVFAMTYDNEAYSLSFDLCAQQMPTQQPSSSTAPTGIPSASVMPSTVLPTSATPTSTRAPSLVPTLSAVPSKSAAPSLQPTSSSRPTICYDIKVIIMTTGATPVEGDVTSWELYEEQSEEVILQGGQFRDDSIEEYVAECVEANSLVFNISNSNGNGFGQCLTCAYFVFVDDVHIGGNVEFVDNDRFHFSVPLNQEPNGHLLSDDTMSMCSGDFLVGFQMDDHPEQITWNVTNDKGEEVLRGGPYYKAYALYREFACLADGRYTFTIYDSEEVPSQGFGNYFVMTEFTNTAISSNFEFGPSETVDFVIGTV